MDPVEQNAIKLDQEAMEIKEEPDRQRKKYNEAWAAYMSSFEAFEVALYLPSRMPIVSAPSMRRLCMPRDRAVSCSSQPVAP